ncbi:MAG: polysaccharide deacetylase family protein [Flavobacteriia bacterium]|nr:polysaccharide deacetylase family protein [Flavobacteriia bacterium]
MKWYRIPLLVRFFYFNRIWRLSSENNTVYLTFDDGPNPEITPFVLDFLKSEKIKATFFCVAENVIKYPEIYSRIIDEGHQVGNHTYRHENSFKVQKSRYLNSIKNASAYIHSTLFRPPYGKLSWSIARILKKKYSIIMWTWLSYDYRNDVSIEEILSKSKLIQAGDILVLHDNQKIAEKQKNLLPKLIYLLKERNFCFEKINV